MYVVPSCDENLGEFSSKAKRAVVSVGGQLCEEADLFQIAPELISGFLRVRKSTTRDNQTPFFRGLLASVTINRTIGNRDP